MFKNLIDGLTTLGNGPAIAYLVGGSLAGMFIGVIPGLGGAVILTIILAFVYHVNVTGTLCLFLATHAASYFSASITSILLNTPAHPEAFAVTFDGFPMAQRGEAGRALGISAGATCVGGLVGCAVLVGFIQIINDLPSLFHPPEYVALIVVALVLIGTLGTDAVSKAIISTGIAIMISSIGSDPTNGVFRYTFGAVGLYTGISIVALFLGLFAIPQMVLVFGTASTIARQNMMGQEMGDLTPVSLEKGFMSQVIRGVLEALSHWVALIRAALIGVVTGLVPGIGGFAANFISYGVAQQTSKTPELFGTGIAEGIIAPEGSSLAKEAGSMVPLLGIGIPGGIGGALFLAALTIKDIKVGYGFTTAYPTLAYEAMWVIAIGGFIGTLAGVLSAPLLAKVTKVPGPALVPFIMAISVVGAFVSDVSFFSVMEVIVFALVGFCLRRLRYSLAAFGIGLVLGPTLEANIYLSRAINPGFSVLSRQPLADALFGFAIVVLVLRAFQLRKASKQANALVDQSDPLMRAEAKAHRDRQNRPYPLLSLIVNVLIVAVCVTFAVFGGTRYNFTTAAMPVMGSGIAAIAAIWRLPFEITGYIQHRKSVKEIAQLEVTPAVSILRTVESSSPVELMGVEALTMPEMVTMAPRTVTTVETRDRELTSERPDLPIVAIREKSWGKHGQYAREVLAFVLFFGLLGACYIFGFEVGVSAFCIVYGLFFTRRIFPSLQRRIIFAVLSALVLWGTTFEMFNLLHLVFTPVVNL